MYAFKSLKVSCENEVCQYQCIITAPYPLYFSQFMMLSH